MLLLPESQAVEENAVGQLTLHVDPHGTPTTGIRALLSYPSDTLQLVDADGNPATEIEAITTALETVFINEATDGSINYQAVAFINDSPVDPFDAAILRFKCVAPGSAQLEFLDGSDVTDPDSNNVTGLTSGATIQCRGDGPEDNFPPEALAGPNQEANEGDTVTLDGSSSVDPDVDDTLSFHWELVTGPTTVNVVGANTATASFVPPDNGSYEFKLTVSDGQDSDTATVVINVLNVAPEVTPGGNKTAQPGETVVLTETTFTDPGTLDTHTATIDWGEGQPEQGTVNEAAGTVSGSHVYTAEGDFIVTITVKDNDGDSGSDTFTVTVREEVPVAGNDWTATLNIRGEVPGGTVSGTPVLEYGIRPGCTAGFEFDNGEPDFDVCDDPTSKATPPTELSAYFDYPKNRFVDPPNPPVAEDDNFIYTQLVKTRIEPPSPERQTRMFPVQVQINKGGATAVDVTVEWDIAPIPGEFITVLLIDHGTLPAFKITNMGRSSTGSYTFTATLVDDTATRDLTVVVTRAHVQAMRLSQGTQILSLTVKPIFGSKVTDIFNFKDPRRPTDPERFSLREDLRVRSFGVTMWYTDPGNPLPISIRGIGPVVVGDPRHPEMVPGFGYIINLGPPIKPKDLMLIIPGDPIIEHTRNSP